MTSAAGEPGNELIREEAPGLWRTLSALGRQIRQPEDFLPQQSAEARGKPLNATIGQITDGHGRAVELPALGAALAALPPAERSRALLYSPLEGLPDLRQRWRERQRRGWPAATLSSLPLITTGPGLARQVLAELFAEEGRTVLLPPPPLPPGLEGARELFELRRGARVLELPAGGGGDRGDRANRGRVGRALDGVPAGEPALVLLAGGGGGAAGADPLALRESLAAAAAVRPVVVLIEDDARDPRDARDPEGQEGIDAAGRLFAELAGRHADLVPFWIEGTAKLGFPGAGLGFLTLPYAPDSRLAQELEKKLKMLLRAAVGSPPALTQVLLLAALAAAEQEDAVGAGPSG
jgi:DNA-binding transcriptional MocR family regulator